MTEKVYKFKLPDSGIEVAVRGIATSVVAMDVVSAFPKPPPPLVQVDYGNGDIRWERNEADPDYKEVTVKDWENDVELKRTRITLRRALVKALTDDEKEQVKEIRAMYADEGMQLKEPDKIIWLKYIACGSDDDLLALFRFIAERGEPNSKPVRDTFPDNVPQS